MTLADHAALLGTIGQDVELLALAGLDDLGNNGSALNNGSADLDRALLANGENLIEGNFAVVLSVQLLDINNVADLNAVLLATGFNNCVHVITSFNKSRWSVGRCAEKCTHLYSPYHAALVSYHITTAVVKGFSSVGRLKFQNFFCLPPRGCARWRVSERNRRRRLLARRLKVAPQGRMRGKSAVISHQWAAMARLPLISPLRGQLPPRGGSL